MAWTAGMSSSRMGSTRRLSGGRATMPCPPWRTRCPAAARRRRARAWRRRRTSPAASRSRASASSASGSPASGSLAHVAPPRRRGRRRRTLAASASRPASASASAPGATSSGSCVGARQVVVVGPGRQDDGQLPAGRAGAPARRAGARRRWARRRAAGRARAARVLAVARPTRRPVNEPGPVPTTIGVDVVESAAGVAEDPSSCSSSAEPWRCPTSRRLAADRAPPAPGRRARRR